MKKLLILFVMAGMILTSCNKNKWAEVDYSDDIVGIWTSLEHDHAAAYVINGDGTVSSFGVDSEGTWEDVMGTYEVENNKISMKFDSGHNIEGSFDIIPGQTLSIVETKTGNRYTFQYCAEDLSEEIIGMWVCTQTNALDAEMAVNIYQEDGKAIFTGFDPWNEGYMANVETTYKVIGDLMIQTTPFGEGSFPYLAFRLTYTPNGTELGDILTNTYVMAFGDEVIESSSIHLRIKQDLVLSGNKYDYSATYVSNVSGSDEEFEFMGHTFSIAGMDGVMMDKMLKALLFSVEFPDANTIRYSCYYEGAMKSIDVPIAVEGNKMTVKMSEKKAVYRDLEVYTFQDIDNCQFHMYMPRTAFVNFFSNMQVAIMAEMGELDITDAAAVEAIYNGIDNAVETINLSFVFKH